MKTFITTIFALALTATIISAGNIGGSGVEIGESVPDFTLPDAAGEVHTLSEYDDKYIVLEWLNHDCPFVRKHYDTGNMQKLQARYGEKDVVWFTIISSAPGKQGYLEPDEALAITREKEAKPFALLLDPEGDVGRAYGAVVTPHMYVIKPGGTLAYMGAIDDNPSANPDDVEGARNFVSEALDNLLDGRSVEVTTRQPYGCTVKY